VVDQRPEALTAAESRCAGRGVRLIEADLSDPARVGEVVEDADIVLGAVGSVIGLRTLRAVIEAGKPFCDICFMAEDALQLDALAKERGVTAVVDCGIAPGVSNMMAGRAAAALEGCDNIEIYVGGLPRERRWPFEYKAGFSPHDVIEEYTRPARLVERGEVVVREALSEPELMEFAGLGTLEAFNTDGLRSIADTLDVPNMKEKTLRYPGHIELMRVFRETGLFSKEPIGVEGGRVRPLDVISALMFPKWTYGEGEEDLTVMRVFADGTRDGRRVRMQWDLLDFYDGASRATSMSRCTAFPCTVVARMIAEGRVGQKGVLAPEALGADEGVFNDVLAGLGARGVRFTSSVTPV